MKSSKKVYKLTIFKKKLNVFIFQILIFTIFLKTLEKLFNLDKLKTLGSKMTAFKTSLLDFSAFKFQNSDCVQNPEYISLEFFYSHL